MAACHRRGIGMLGASGNKFCSLLDAAILFPRGKRLRWRPTLSMKTGFFELTIPQTTSPSSGVETFRR
jgi:hypothetical protein